MSNVVSNTRADLVARGVIKGVIELGFEPGREDRHLPRSRSVGSGRVQDPRRSTASTTAIAPSRSARPRSARSRRSGAEGTAMGVHRSQGFRVHRSGHHRARGAELHPRVSRVRLQDRRRRHARQGRPRSLRRAGLRHGARDHRAKRKVDGTVITVPLAFAPDAAFEAIDAGIKLIVIITEGIPRKDASADDRVRQPARRARHRTELPRAHHSRRLPLRQPRRPGGRLPQGVQAGHRRRHVALGRNDDRDLQRAVGGRPRREHRDLDRRRPGDRLDLRRADAAVRGGSGHQGGRHLLRAGRRLGGGAGALGARRTRAGCRSWPSSPAASWTTCRA